VVLAAAHISGAAAMAIASIIDFMVESFSLEAS
jgi:hypothetical protein